MKNFRTATYVPPPVRGCVCRKANRARHVAGDVVNLDPQALVFAASLVLALAAIVVAISTISLIRSHVSLTRAQSAPRLQFAVKVVEDPLSGHNTRESLYVHNIGGPLEEFRAEPLVFLIVQFGANSKRRLQTIDLPVVAYYDAVKPTGAGQDLLATFENVSVKEGNDTKGRSLIVDFEKAAESISGFQRVRGKVMRYVRATYRDLWGAGHEGVYEVDPLYGGRRLSSAEGQAIFKRHQSLMNGGRALDFLHVTADELMKKWLTATRMA